MPGVDSKAVDTFVAGVEALGHFVGRRERSVYDDDYTFVHCWSCGASLYISSDLRYYSVYADGPRTRMSRGLTILRPCSRMDRTANQLERRTAVREAVERDRRAATAATSERDDVTGRTGTLDAAIQTWAEEFVRPLFEAPSPFFEYVRGDSTANWTAGPTILTSTNSTPTYTYRAVWRGDEYTVAPEPSPPPPSNVGWEPMTGCRCNMCVNYFGGRRP